MPSLDVSYSTKVYFISLNSSLKEHWQDPSATREFNSSLKEHWQDPSGERVTLVMNLNTHNNPHNCFSYHQ
ncbi:hypothetical protein QUB77_09450 [Microcoleus sp. AT9b-C3]